ncbi:hypothetical protein DY000_02036151 [Brassica cretica]|uniref:Uncharacterized protein n=1 Tax=Brassica cretica TaxID=69181 RepID=A0ABQ7DNH2_BRACR|nr:hypothetical protein DY000_02036151 [Brassica cretica]
MTVAGQYWEENEKKEGAASLFIGKGEGAASLFIGKGEGNRRYYSGILVGTLGVAGYLHMIHHMQALISAAGKKSYILAMGNFHERLLL